MNLDDGGGLTGARAYGPRALKAWRAEQFRRKRQKEQGGADSLKAYGLDSGSTHADAVRVLGSLREQHAALAEAQREYVDMFGDESICIRDAMRDLRVGVGHIVVLLVTSGKRSK